MQRFRFRNPNLGIFSWRFQFWNLSRWFWFQNPIVRTSSQRFRLWNPKVGTCSQRFRFQNQKVGTGSLGFWFQNPNVETSSRRFRFQNQKVGRIHFILYVWNTRVKCVEWNIVYFTLHSTFCRGGVRGHVVRWYSG